MPREKFNLERVIQAIESNGGFVSDVAKALKVSRVAIWQWRKKYKTVDQCFQDVENSHLDLAESKLIKAVKDGKAWAICFYLKCKGRERGYIERVERDIRGRVAFDNDESTHDEIGRAISAMSQETLIHVIKNAKMQYDERFKT